ncbi:MAG TPA: YggU family protein [Epsilonproteobacteria bacterium]|nr:YggU family protein [Campylobacterota bacterium]
MFYSIKQDEVLLHIKAQPNASKSEFCGLYGDGLIKIRLKAPAVEGAANEALITFLAKSFKVPKKSIMLKSGKTSKHKTIAMPLSEKFKEWIITNGY